MYNQHQITENAEDALQYCNSWKKWHAEFTYSFFFFFFFFFLRENAVVSVTQKNPSRKTCLSRQKRRRTKEKGRKGEKEILFY